ncbi:thrombospondin, type I, domain containing 7A [Elysia marginata]|uniref:Thrombospondin, type I, domain containing 7A n=1 Tax=Elysia marginata TaxID=1093978 RepID=A0AAV4FRU7_9GAST|nr:thrombospondin, type I, domain containing 7A [Elysia marginata]
MEQHHMIGYQTRDVTCLQSKGVVASLKSCLDALRDTAVPRAQACVMPQDCEVSEWSGFSHLNDSCLKPDGTVRYGFKVRSRQILQFPLGDGRPCPPALTDYLQQTDMELRDLKYCQRAKWIESDWSPCRPVPGHNNCATGMQTRTAICVEMDGTRLFLL